MANSADDLQQLLQALSAQFSERLRKELPEYCTPAKMGAQTEEANTNAGVAAVKQIVTFFEKGDKTFQVNK